MIETETAEVLLAILEVILGEGNLIFCLTGSWENYFTSFGRENNNNPRFLRVGKSKNKNIDHRGKETCT